MERFHRTLIEVSRHITSDILDNLKYMCQDVVVPTRMEKVRTARDLFQALEECGKISINNTQYLIDLLEAEGKSHLITKLAPFNHGSVTDVFQETLSSYVDVQQPHQPRVEFPNVPEAQLNVYRQVLRQISNSLRGDDLQSLCYSSQEASMAGIQHRANVNGITLFNFLEKKLLISPDNLEYLRELLYTIGRMDLQNLIEQYTRSYLGGHPIPLSGQAPVVQQQQYGYQQPPAYNPTYHPGNINNTISILFGVINLYINVKVFTECKTNLGYELQ